MGQRHPCAVMIALKQTGWFAVDHSKDGEDGLHMSFTEAYDTAIIDIMLPKLDGLSIIKTLRQRYIYNIPVLILSAKRTVVARVRGIQKSGDDYLIKPFAFSELLVRVQALIRMASGAVEPSSLTVGDLSVDLLRRDVSRAGKKLTRGSTIGRIL